MTPTPRLKNLTSRDRTQLIRVYPVIHCKSTGTGFADLSPTRRHSQPTGRASVACDQIKLGYESPLCSGLCNYAGHKTPVRPILINSCRRITSKKLVVRGHC
ncbi:hypothetical protein BDV30DRAFT_162391 [Aspergillus minisclerotigenes]|uniref:Uncharacterized protein n=1 Tax=Aspergillus minisclerotigenes TaxID=656917 RepID=A0A5N6IZI3_9EURO|nr:hypothetical protein BDV30DRAFT_162391 [Aspergillus minisclerotigenes]